MSDPHGQTKVGMIKDVTTADGGGCCYGTYRDGPHGCTCRRPANNEWRFAASRPHKPWHILTEEGTHALCGVQQISSLPAWSAPTKICADCVRVAGTPPAAQVDIALSQANEAIPHLHVTRTQLARSLATLYAANDPHLDHLLVKATQIGIAPRELSTMLGCSRQAIYNRLNRAAGMSMPESPVGGRRP